ncbi:MAG: mechanosensitive ion channel domain-containing protein [Planctomycetota bacterium]|jgi:potassium efflux system protein
MRLPQTIYPSLLCLAAILITPSTSAWAQEEQAATTASTQDPALDKAAVQARIDEIEQDTGLEEETKQTALENLRAALKDLEAAEKHQTNTEEYKRSIAEDSDAAKAILSEIEAAPETGEPEAFASLSPDEMRAERDKEESNNSAIKAELSEQEAAVQALETRPSAAREQQTKMVEDLAQTEADLDLTPAEGTAAIIVETRRNRLLARRHALSRQQQMLEQEVLSLPMQLELAKARRDRQQRRVDESSARLAALESSLADVQRVETEAAQRQAEAEQRAAENEHPAVKRVAQKNADLSAQLAQVVEDQDPASQARTRSENQFTAVRETHIQIKERLEASGLTGFGGSLLPKQRRQMTEILTDLRASRRRWAGRSAEAEGQRLELFLLERELQDPELVTAGILDAADPPLEGNERADVQTQILSLLETRKDLVQKLTGGYKDLLKNLHDLSKNQDELRSEVRAFATLLDRWLLWMPSTTRETWDIPGHVDGINRLLSANRLQRSWEVFRSQVSRHWILSGIASLLLLGIALFRRPIKRRLETINGQIRRISTDRIGLTIESLGLITLLIAPIPLLVAGVALTIWTSGTLPSIATGLFTATGIAAIISFARQLCGERGIAALHFKWPTATIASLRRNLGWLRWIIIPITYLVYSTNAQPNEEIRDGVGRLSFVIGALAFLVLWQRILKPSGPVIQPILARAPSGWLARLKWLWYPTALAVPLALGVLAFLGYYYTALELDICLFWTIILFLVVLILRAVAMRWLLIEQRRMAIQRFQEQRAAEAEQGEVSKDSEIPVPEDVEIDLSEVNDQTRSLVKMATFFTLLLGVWGIWYSVLPALGFLDRVQLWTHEVIGSDGTPLDEWITLQDVFLSIVLVILTVTATKNVPGLLQLVVLKNLPISASGRYAIVTITRYVLTITGIIASVQVLGFSWSSVQWLVAAMGVGIGFGLQEIIANFICGLILLFERPVRIGDSVTIGDTSGIVTRIHMRATTITDWDRKEMLIPNKELITGRVLNWTLTSTLNRALIPVGIAYGTDTDTVRRLLIEVAKADPRVLDDPEPLATFEGFGNSTLDFQLRAYLRDYEGRLSTISELRTAIDERFKAAGIVIAFPQLDLHLRSAEAAVQVEQSRPAMPPAGPKARSQKPSQEKGAEAS